MGLIENLFGSRDVKAREDFPRDPAYIGSFTYSSRFINRTADTYLSAYGGTQAIDWVMDCVRLIYETGASAPYHFEKDDEKVENPNEELAALIREPNPYMDYEDLMSVSLIDLLMVGEFFIHKHVNIGGKPLALYRLAPQYVEIVPGETKLIDHYEYKLPGKTKPVRIEPEDMIHAKLPNPHNPYRGLSIIAGGPRVYDVELSLTESQAQFFEAGTKLSGVLQTDRRVPDTVFKKIQRQFRSMYSGASNAYKVAVLEAGLKFTPIQPTAAEAEFVNLSKLTRDRIAHMFRVPLPLLGNLENANYKMSEAQRVFDTKTMRPLLDKIERIITRGVTDAWGVEFKIDYKYVMPDEDRFKLAESVAAVPGIKVVEVREVLGFKPLGDERDDIVLNLPVEGEPNRPLGSDPGRPPNGENVPNFPGPGQPLPARTGGPAQRPQRPEITGGRRRDAKAMFDPANPDPLKDSRDATVDNRAHRIAAAIEVAATALEIQLTSELRSDTKAKIDDLTRKIKKSPAWDRFQESVEKAMLKNARESMEQAQEQHGIIGFNPQDFDVDEVAKQLVRRPNGIKSIVGNFKNDVSKVVSEGVKRGYNADQILHGTGDDYLGLRGTMVAWRRGQAETIALTEAAEYYNEGVLQVADANGAGHVLVLDGEDHDEPCRRANGEVWTVGRARENRTEHPRCRRSFFPIGIEQIVAPPGPDRADVKALDFIPMPQKTVIDLQNQPIPDFHIDNPVTVNVPENPISVTVEPPPPAEINVSTPAKVGAEEIYVERDEHGQLTKIRRVTS